MHRIALALLAIAYSALLGGAPDICIIDSEYELVIHIPPSAQEGTQIQISDESLQLYLVSSQEECTIHCDKFSGEITVEELDGIIRLDGSEVEVQIPQHAIYVKASGTGAVRLHCSETTIIETVTPFSTDTFSVCGSWHFKQGPYIGDAQWKEIQPYLLAEHHPMFAPVDAIFRASRATFSNQTFKAAGFSPLAQKDHLLVGTHKDLPGHLVKAVPDIHRSQVPLNTLVTRAQVAARMQKVIKEYGLSRVAIPVKLIYPLPAQPQPPEPVRYPKGFVLVETQLSLLSPLASRALWTNDGFWDGDMLRELYILLSHVPIKDCCFNNIRFTHDKRQVALFDFEQPAKSLKNFNKNMASILPLRWRAYWHSLMRNDPTR